MTNFKMIDVGRKRTTRRFAIASGWIAVGEAAFQLIRDKKLPKGDVLALAEMAGIMAAKNTPNTIPLCHTLPLDQVVVECHLVAPDAVHVTCQVTAHATTGVEMEALAGVNGALLTIWDLAKGTEPNLQIGGVRLLVKQGGKSGLWINPDGIPESIFAQLPNQKPLDGLNIALIVLSDRAAKGTYEDKSGPLLQNLLGGMGARICDLSVIPDDPEQIKSHVGRIFDEYTPDIIITSGGTGLSPRDITPDVLMGLCDRTIPGIGELLRGDGASVTDMAWISRSFAGVMGQTLVIALPGSPKAVKDGVDVLWPILPHAVSMVRGGNHG